MPPTLSATTVPSQPNIINAMIANPKTMTGHPQLTSCIWFAKPINSVEIPIDPMIGQYVPCGT